MDKVFLQTDRLIIRNFEKKDAEGLLRLLSNPRVNCFAHEKLIHWMKHTNILHNQTQNMILRFA
jgi:hypothetical protein